MKFRSARMRCAVVFLLMGFHASLAQFSLLDPRQTGVTFTNRLTETENANVLAYEYFYNGGGVAVGDLNNDGLPDLYFTGNMVPDRLYLNLGNLKFRDVSPTAGIGKGSGWKTGVTLVDINRDGWLDIYVCYSGSGAPETRKNRLYVNNGPAKTATPGSPRTVTFTEKAAQYGLDLPTFSTQAAFFDYDRDGDLDCYLLNHNIKDFKRFDAAAVKAMRDEFAGDRLLRNDNGKFIDVSEAAGIRGNPIGFGLGIAVADINQDGWPDLYVSNDYIEQDYLYLNEGNGHFTDQLDQAVGHLSYFSMGNEVVDVNNDGWPDIFTLDMLPEDNRRQKLLYGPENYEVYQNMLRNGFYHQLMRNMLQLNTGVIGRGQEGTGKPALPQFSEIGQLAGVSNTDWSWAPLVADFDNDGWKDLYITNGYLRDYTNMDFMKFYADQNLKAAKGSPTAMMDILKQMPSSQTQHYIFRNNGRLTFENRVKEWGMDQKFLSNGAVYADLDNDGDLEIITSNINAPASIYRNDSWTVESRYLQIQPGPGPATLSAGTKVWVYTGGAMQYQEFQPSRGFQSAMYMPLHFGVGKAAMIDSVRVVWPDRKVQVLRQVKSNQKLILKPEDAQPGDPQSKPAPQPVFTEAVADTLPYRHTEDTYNDFKRQLLIPNMLSFQGPHLAQADVDRDGLTDLYAAGAKGQPGTLLLQQKNGGFQAMPQPAFEADKMYEDTDALFFDADGDGDADLYVVSGGFAYLAEDLLLQDRLYLNDGRGKFTRSAEGLPGEMISDACAVAFDFDKDGDQDLFVGGRVVPGRYPEPVSSRLLVNDGKGKFTDETARLAPFLTKIGMVTDAVAFDADKDGWPDLVFAGEWMPVTLLKNANGQKFNHSTIPSLNNSPGPGWWNRIEADDLDNDGDLDLVVGNFGRNCQMKPTDKEPVTMVYGDFDQNEAVDPFLCYYIQGRSYPLVSRDEALNQLFPLRRKFPTYESYSSATLKEILTPEQLNKADTLRATAFASVLLENTGSGFVSHELPVEAQFAPVYAIALFDYDGDGRKDLLLGGNQSHTRIRIGKMDANYGMLFRNEGQCRFSYVPQTQSGFRVKGDVRDILVLKQGTGVKILFGRNNETIEVYQKPGNP
ncbi:VCBS repeat-containing protein [Larkinella soli]|uniref:VCBS repeat-containing protein n=1 Tax=Larkinella soli TaxID=1770527 RepID=UPI000FFCA752|nr:VCBS repeat-containing protein [Larkinella soli]